MLTKKFLKVSKMAKVENGLQGKQKQKRQRMRRIAPDELSLPNTKESWLLLNAIVYGLRLAYKQKLEKRPLAKTIPHLFKLPKGLVDKSNGKVFALSTANGDASCKIYTMAFEKAIEALDGDGKRQKYIVKTDGDGKRHKVKELVDRKGTARFLKYKFVHCLFLILDKFKMVSRTDGGEIVLTTTDLQDYGILPNGQGAKPLFEALRAILLNTELSRVGRLFKQIECTHGRLVLTTCRGDAYKNFCKYFCGVKKAALFELSQRELLALRYLVGVRAFKRGKNKSASLNTLIKFAGFSLGALQSRHFGKLQSILNATLDKIQVFLNFDVAVDRSPQSLKALLNDGAVNLISNKVKEYAQNARVVGFKFFWAHFARVVEGFYKRHVSGRKAKNTLQIVENEASDRMRPPASIEFSFGGGGVENELG